MSEFQWVPLTQDELERNAGLGPLIDQAAAGDALAALALKRLRAAMVTLQPEIDALRVEMERAWMAEGSCGPGLSLLLD